ncbi:MAG: hypothetical protein ACR2F6_02945 [Mycobacteriales bacterium]
MRVPKARLDAELVPPRYAVATPGWRARDMAAYVAEVVLASTAIRCGTRLSGRTTRARITGIATERAELAHLTVITTRHPLVEATA